MKNEDGWNEIEKELNDIRVIASATPVDAELPAVDSTALLDALAKSFAAESGKVRQLEDTCVHEEDRKRARDRGCILMDIASALRSASNDSRSATDTAP